jgi:hypothetical protein
MARIQRDEPGDGSSGLWVEALWSAGLLGTVVLLVVLISIIGRL